MRNEILSPSAGRVIEVKKERGHYHVSIFLAVWDNHSQFIPYDCECIRVTYKPGEFHMAHILGKSDKNERSQTVFNAAFGMFVVTQIAGLVARRIINHCKRGSKYKKGTEYGEILLGSRVDITLPEKGITINVKKGELITGAKTVIAFYEDNKKQLT